MQTAHDIGLADLTLRAVADRLGVTVASLYHYVSGRDELARLAAEFGAHRLPMPVDHGQHWAIWLREWARFIRRSWVGQPELLAQYVDGALTADVTASNIDAVFGVLLRAGFDLPTANIAYDLIASYAIGRAVGQTRRTRATASGRRLPVRDPALAADLPVLQQLQQYWASEPQPTFDDRVETLLAGIAAVRGEPWEPIAKLLAADRPPVKRAKRRSR